MVTRIKPHGIDPSLDYTFDDVTANTVTVTAGIIANGSLGTTGQVLTSNGSVTYWTDANFGSGGSGAKGDKGDKGSLGSLQVTLDSFVSDGLTAEFTLTNAPTSIDYTIITINGVQQNKTEYTVVGNVVTFSENVSEGAVIEVTTFAGGAKGEPGTYAGKGDKGDAGTAGSKGDKGDKGLDGNGTKGDKGDAGTAGSKGDKGTDGTNGTKGDKGDVGAKGSDGTAGVDGTKGDKGEAGVGTKGDKGDAGVKGDKGVLGAVEVTVDTFAGNGSNTQFTLSVAPDSVSQTLVNIGGVFQPRSTYAILGTTFELDAAPASGEVIEVTTLSGGAKGEPGVDGTVGAKGEKGDVGSSGATGAKGDKGDTGTDGTIGVDGAKGDKGDLGTKGDKGDTSQSSGSTDSATVIALSFLTAGM